MFSNETVPEKHKTIYIRTTTGGHTVFWKSYFSVDLFRDMISASKKTGTVLPSGRFRLYQSRAGMTAEISTATDLCVKGAWHAFPCSLQARSGRRQKQWFYINIEKGTALNPMANRKFVKALVERTVGSWQSGELLATHQASSPWRKGTDQI